MGYGLGSWTPFLTGGFAWASTRLSRTDFTTGVEDATAGRLRAGYVVGAGIDHALDKSWSARFDSLRVFWYRRIVSFDRQSQEETLRALKVSAQRSGQHLREAGFLFAVGLANRRIDRLSHSSVAGEFNQKRLCGVMKKT